VRETIAKTLIELYAAKRNLSRNKQENGTEVPCLLLRSVLRRTLAGSNSDWLSARGNGVLWLFMRLLLVLFLLPSLLSAAPQSTSAPADDYSGMYTFLREGEFIQVTVEDAGRVSGFISRFGDSDNDKTEFLDQFFESGKLDSSHLSFTTKNVHGTWFTFDGTLGRGAAKKPEDEGYYVIRGTLNRFRSDADKKSTSQDSRSVEFKSFPRDVTP
jgi:hypothetical protein